MIFINENRQLEPTLEESPEKICTLVYQKLVAERKNLPNWNMPKPMKNFVPKLIKFIEKTNYKIPTYIESQFFFFSPDFCKKAFNILYPPITSLMTDKSVKRCERYVVYVESLESRLINSDQRNKKIMLEYAQFKTKCIDKNAEINKNTFHAMVVSGVISPHCLALIKYLMPTYLKEVDDAFDFLNYMEGYTMTIGLWRNCTKYIERRSKKEWLKN